MVTTSVDARGRISLFDGARVVARVTRRGTAKASARPPVWARVHTVHYVVGGSLDRVAVVNKLGADRLDCIIHRATAHQVAIHCDTCPKVHRASNPSCSANLHLTTFATLPGHLYDIGTRADKGAWAQRASFLGASKTADAIFQRS